MSIKEDLTNEKLKEIFDNSFQVVNYAISLAKQKIERGEELDSNPAEEILEMIVDGTDKFEFAPEKQEEEDNE